MQTATFIREIESNDKEGNDVTLLLFQHDNGGVFAIDASYIEQCFEDESKVIIQDPFNVGRIALEDI